MGLTATAAGWFLLAAAPISFFVAFSDLARMKIPNVAVGALVVSYAILGLLTLPLDVYLWGYVHFIVALVVGIAVNAAGLIGAGDAKFVAAASPMIAVADLPLLIPLFAACLIAGYLTHRIAKHTPLQSLVPHWESWDAGRRFPMGFPLGMALVFYLALVFMTR
jgi:prepilin peptidase CpaA